MAAGFAGVRRAPARLENSAPVLVVWSFTLAATGPIGEMGVSKERVTRLGVGGCDGHVIDQVSVVGGGEVRTVGDSIVGDLGVYGEQRSVS